MNFFPFHINDYSGATSHLSWDEDMAYTRLLRAYYQAEKPIPKAQVYRFARCASSAQRKAVDTVLAEFFVLDADAYRQRRCDEEIAHYQDKQAKAKRSADIKWAEVRTQCERNANASPKEEANAMRTHSEGNANGMPRAPVPKNHEPRTNPQIPDGWTEFWSVYPKKVNKPAALKAYKAAKLNGNLPQVLADVERRMQGEEWTKQNRQFVPNPATYLNNRRWEEPTTASTPWEGAK
jgi:uncharacterized protein YdaU (DUF1376 family)